MLIKKIYIMKGTGTAKSVLKIALLENGYAEIDLQTHFAYGDNYTFILKSGNFIHVESMRSKGLKRKLQPFALDGLCTGIAKDGKIIMWCADTPNVPYCLVELAQKYTMVEVKKPAEENERMGSSTQKAVVSTDLKYNNEYDIQSIDVQNVSSETKQFEPSESDKEESYLISDESSEISNTTEKTILIETSEVVSPDSISAVSSEQTGISESVSKDITGDFNILSIESESMSDETDENNGTYSMAREIELKYSSYPHNETLENVFPDSKWILTETDDLSLGLLYNSEKITHICYAKKGEKDSSFDHNASYYEGWWVVFTENE